MNTLTPVLAVIAGPAGSGKTTLCDRIVRECPRFKRVVTTTTRPPRKGEIDGVHYHFLTVEDFKRKAEQNEFLEWTEVHVPGRYYGTLRSSVIDELGQGQSLIMNVDVKGIRSMKALAMQDAFFSNHLLTIFLRVSIDTLRARMLGRNTESTEEIERRMITAQSELLEASGFDFTIESGTPDEDFAELCDILDMMR